MPNILLDVGYVKRLKAELAEAKGRIDLADKLAENYSDKADKLEAQLDRAQSTVFNQDEELNRLTEQLAEADRFGFQNRQLVSDNLDLKGQLAEANAENERLKAESPKSNRWWCQHGYKTGMERAADAIQERYGPNHVKGDNAALFIRTEIKGR